VNHRERSRQRRGSRLDDLALDLFAMAWLARGMWRIGRGRLPWQAAPARRRGG